MGLEAVKEEILGSAKQQADSMLAEAKKESDRQMKEAQKKAEELMKKSEGETKKAIESIKRQELAFAELENKKLVLGAKKDIIESVFAEAAKKIQNQDDKKREQYIKKLLDKSGSDIEISHIYCNKKDAKFVKGMNVQNTEISGGIIAENKDKTIRVDYSFDTALQSIKETELQNISKLLFG